LFDLPFDQLSYLGIFTLLVLTGLGLPLPEEVVVVAAGIASSHGTLDPWWAFPVCLVGALAGDTILYSLGYHFGHSLVYRHPRMAALLHADREARLEQMVRKHEVKVLVLSRFMVGIRAPVYLAAGILRVPFARFFLIDVISGTAVVSLFFGLSYAYGERLTRLIKQSEIGLTVAIAVGVAVLVCTVWWKRRRRRFLLERIEASDTEEPCAVAAHSSKH
jgi:membrane protein DedA with SNARE-associated domain